MNLTQISASAVFYGSVIMLGIFALPSFIGAIKQSGIVRTLLLFVTLGLIIIGYETLAVKTGLPSGKFSYGTAMGRKLFDTTPWIVAIFYPPIVIGCFWLARKISEGALSTIFTMLFITLTYLVFAPVFTKLGFLNWESGGQVLGVPARAFGGWLICALISAIAITLIWGENEVKRLSAYSLFVTLLFWTGASFGATLKVPSIIGIVVCLIIGVLFIAERRQDHLSAE